MDSKNFFQFVRAARASVIVSQEGTEGFAVCAEVAHPTEEGKIEREKVILATGDSKVKQFKTLKSVGDMLRDNGVNDFRVVLQGKKVVSAPRKKKPAAKNTAAA